MLLVKKTKTFISNKILKCNFFQQARLHQKRLTNYTVIKMTPATNKTTPV